MTTLAPKLPYSHPFAGGYPRIGGQPLPTDPDAIDYLDRVAAVEGAAVEQGVAMAVDAFVKGCKADGIWDAIKASCIMCGARTISGALVPLVGAAPTNNNFIAADYNRETGLVGNAINKFLDSNRASNADPQDSAHLSVYVSAFGATANRGLAGSVQRTPTVIAKQFYYSSGLEVLSAFHGADLTGAAVAGTATFVGVSRASSSLTTLRYDGTDVTSATASSAPSSRSIFIFGRNDENVSTYTAARLAFYSIGEGIDLAALDTRISALVTAIGAAI